jgi:phage gp45-like
MNIGTITNNEIMFFQNNGNRMKITGDGLIPAVTNTYDLGSASLVWRNIYTSDFHMSNEGLDKGNDIDGTKGSWTFQEGEENLYLINNKNGKKYKFNLTEIE